MFHVDLIFAISNPLTFDLKRTIIPEEKLKLITSCVIGR